MKLRSALTTLSLGLLLSAPTFAQTTADTNDQARKDLKTDAKQQHHVDKAQAKADKADEKALGSRKVKKAAKAQDKANNAAAAAGTTQPQ